MLTPDEILSLSTEAIELGQSLAAALRSDSPGGRRITRAEGRELVRMAAELAAVLAREVLD